jgi:hypothetical protein
MTCVLVATGIVTKNVEALVSGIPLITTPDGLRGLGVRPIQQALIPVAADALSFARLALEFQLRPSLHRQAQRRGLEHARQFFSLEAQCESLSVILGLRSPPSTPSKVGRVQELADGTSVFASPMKSEARTPQAVLESAGATWSQLGADGDQADVMESVEFQLSPENTSTESARQNIVFTERAREVLRCPLRSSNDSHRSASNVTASLLNFHAYLINTGYSIMPNTRSNWPELSPIVFESGDWPKPATCITHARSTLDPVVHLLERKLVKHVNHRRQVEIHQVWKGGSTMIGPLLHCLQPGEWEDVPQRTPERKLDLC